jgi:hypothetical protein
MGRYGALSPLDARCPASVFFFFIVHPVAEILRIGGLAPWHTRGHALANEQ